MPQRSLMGQQLSPSLVQTGQAAASPPPAGHLEWTFVLCVLHASHTTSTLLCMDSPPVSRCCASPPRVPGPQLHSCPRRCSSHGSRRPLGHASWPGPQPLPARLGSALFGCQPTMHCCNLVMRYSLQAQLARGSRCCLLHTGGLRLLCTLCTPLTSLQFISLWHSRGL